MNGKAKNPAAVSLVAKRWSKTSKAERRKHALKMVAARRQKRSQKA